MLTLDSTLVELLRGAWPAEWRTTDIELLFTRLAASGKLRIALEYELGLRGEAEAVLARTNYMWPGAAAGARTRRRRLLAATVGLVLCSLIGWQWFLHAHEEARLAAERAQSVNNKSAAEELSAAVSHSESHGSARNASSGATETGSKDRANERESQAATQPGATAEVKPPAEETPAPAAGGSPAAEPAVELANEPVVDPADEPAGLADLPLDRNAAGKQPLRGRRMKGARRDAVAVDRPAREHPLELEPSREAQTLSLEIFGALDEEQWTELQRVLESITPSTLGSLVADAEDESLWVSYSTLADGLLSQHAGLRTLIQTKLEPLAKLRLAAALETRDADQIAAVAWHFYGTDASSQAHLWLADHALSMGNFAAARTHYERAKVYASPTTRNELAARLRLAGAMLGKPLEKSVTSPVQWASNRLSPIDFEAMVLTQQLTHQRRYVSPAMVGADSPAPNVPAASKNKQPFQLTDWLKYDDLASSRRVGSTLSAEDAPFAELFSLPVGELTILGNALSVSAIETRTAKVRWQKDLTSARERHGLRAIGPVMPTVADGRIYVRQWTREGTELICLNLTSGDVLWKTELTPDENKRTLRGIMLTDPQIDGQHLSMLTAVPAENVSLRQRHKTDDILWEVRLTEFSRQNGALLRERTLAQLTGLTQVPRASRVLQAGRWRVLQVAGTVLCLDGTGELAWIRRVPWQEMEQFDASYRCAAVTDGKLVCVWQPGGTTVECLEIASGQRRWQAPASQVTRLVGVQDNRLITVTSEGLEALDLKDGQVVWSRKLSWTARQAVLCGSPGGLMFAEAQQTPTGSWEGKLVWLDAATGATKSTASLGSELPEYHRPIQPLIGPLTPHGKGLLAGYDAGQRRGQHRQLLWITPPE